MNELEEYRQRMIERLEQAVQELRAASQAVRDPRQAAPDGGWNVHQLVAHTRDVDRDAYGLRLRRTLAEDDPLVANYDPDNWLATVYKADEPLGKILQELTESARQQAELLRSLPAEAWSRPSRHETLGAGFTAQTWVERNLAHMEEHLATMREAQQRDAKAAL